MKIKPTFIMRDVAGIHLLMSVGRTEEKSSPAMKLNDTAALLFNRLSDGANEDELISAILTAYEVSEEIARRDVSAFLDSLRKIGALEE